ncbi:monocarboxylate transporter 12-like [Asterias amurensis]|uniref:monocarboxylate transporter 12-like n=1 Tax=Asterias amurensis TaxID=7602 RepID=UPI003AB391B5
MGAPAVGPWRWVILLVRTAVCFLSFGIIKSMGVFIDEFVEYFECSTLAAGLVVSLPFTIGMVTGIFTGVLLRIMGTKLLMIFSGAVFSVSLIIAAVVSTTFVHIALCFVACSFGFSIMQTVSVAVLLQYFPDNFASMNGVSLTGGPLGMMVVPPVVQQLIQLYGWRGALALFGAMSANFCVFASLVRPLRTRNSYKPIADGEPSSTTNPPPNESLWDNWRQRFGAMCEEIDLQMFFDEPGFVTTQIINFVEGILFFGWHIYLIPNGIALGFNETRSSFLATFAGFGTMFGRILSGFLIDHGLVQEHNLFAVSSFLLALVCFLDPIAAPSYEAVATIATLGGFFFGVIYPLLMVLSVNFPEERRVSALSWMFLFSGFGLSAGGFIIGWIYDVTGDYGVAFCTMGVFSAIMGVLSLTLRPTCFPCKTQDLEKD